MSWAAHNSEKYDELVRKGIVHYIDSRLKASGWAADELLGPGIWGLVELIQTDTQLHSVYDELLRLCNSHITNAEQDYFSGIIDQAKERFDE